MGKKLGAPPPRLGALPSRLGSTPKTEQERSRHRDRTQPWRAWYRTKEWQQIRRAALIRDGFTCQQTGVPLVGKHPAPNSPVGDHIDPHRGDRAKFFDINNVQSVSKAYHDGEKQKLEYAGRT